MHSIAIRQEDVAGERTVSLDGDDLVYAETATTVRGYAPTVSLTGRVPYVSTPPREVDVSIVIRTHTGAATEDICIVGSRSLYGHNTWMVVDGWRQRVVITKVKADDIAPGIAKVTMTVTLLDGVWRRDDPAQHFALGVASAEQQKLQAEVAKAHAHRARARIIAWVGQAGWIDYPYDYMYDYGAPPVPDRLEIDGSVSSDQVWLGLTIYGPCVNPTIKVGGNQYTVNATLDANTKVVIDPVDHTAVSVTGDTRADVFLSCVRGNGVGDPTYIFEPLPITRYIDADGSIKAKSIGVDATVPVSVDIMPIYKELYVW